MMKTTRFFVVPALLCLFAWVRPTEVLSQPLTDSTVNYFTLSAYYDSYYDSLIEQRGAENMQGTGYKDYLRWKWFNCRRHGVNGDLGDIWEGIRDYHDNYITPVGYTDESDWNFLGPKGIPYGHNGDSTAITGKGMMLSLWVSSGDHSLIYAGSHHGGLWKTIDGGDNWFPLHDPDSVIHGVNSIAVDPEDHKTIYITCNNSLGEFSGYYAGLFKSTDGGDNWNSLTIPGVNYPTSYWGSKVRKIMIHPDDPQTIIFISYRDVYKSENDGENWEKIFSKPYYPWGDSDSTNFDYHNGLFDLKVAPWNKRLYYLAGSEIFQIKDSLGLIDTLNLSDEIFLINSGDVLKNPPHRCEISMHANFPNKVWFCYVADYIINGVDSSKLRIVELDKTNNTYDLLLNVYGPQIGASGDKLEFAVSPSDEEVFYVGGIEINKMIDGDLIDLVGSPFPGDCWVHMDIRDMQLFSNSEGNDTLYLANDAGISWGTQFKQGQTGCGNGTWNWRNPFDSFEHGLDVTEFYGIGLSQQKPGLIAGGCQDLSHMLLDSNQWINFGPIGDGSELVFSPNNPDIFYFSEWQRPRLFRTKTRGEVAEEFYTLGGLNQSSIIIPMELDPLDPSILYSGGNKLLQFSGVDHFNQTVPEPDILAVYSDFITDIEVIETGWEQKRFFVSTMKKYDYNPSPPPSSEFDSCIFWSDDGKTFKDISSDLDGCRYGFISDIEVDPFNPDQIWVCAVGYSKNDQDSKVFKLSLSGGDWQDFSQGLPAGLPVFKIRYIPQIGRLLAATDVGIFKRDQTDTIWYPYQTNFPAKIVTDLEVNIPYRKIVAATYGRGLWETEIEDYCDNTADAVEIEEHITWSDETLMNGDLIIRSGGLLEIVDCAVFVPDNAVIIVEQGGKLILNNAHITSSCAAMWAGIEVWGTPGESQYNQQYFGRLEIKNGSVIEHARTGIANYRKRSGTRDYIGGIILASWSIFRNNQISVDLHPFRNYHPVHPDMEVPYWGRFKSCRFENTMPLLDAATFKYFVQMFGVSGPTFYGCDFVNEMGLSGKWQETSDKYSSGIYSIGSQFFIDQYCTNPDIQPCTQYKPSTFTGLNYGIYAMGIDPVYPVSVNKSIFSDNVTGMYLSGISNATVTSNEFHVNDKYDVYKTYAGLYLDFCTGYSVEENSFAGGLFGAGDTAYVFGMVVKDSGEESNEIYNNYFNNINVGIEALNHNRSEYLEQGLVIKCNEFNINTFNNIVVARINDTINPAGIARFQGSGQYVTSPAGNLFWIEPNSPVMHYINDLDLYPIFYTMHKPSSNIRVKPVNYTSNTITLDSTAHLFTKILACLSHLPIPSPVPGELKAELAAVGLKIDTAQTELDIWVDGGNTEETVTEVAFSTPPEAYDTYADLMLKSPYLSDTVMKESVGKEEVLNNTMIEDILVANPQSAKSVKVTEALDNKTYPLNEQQRENIDQGIFIASPKEKLEAKLAYHIHTKAMIHDDIISIYLNDTVNSWAQDSLSAFLMNENTLLSNYQLSFLKMKEGDSTSAMIIMNNIQNTFDLTAAQLSVHQQYETYAQLMASCPDTGDWFRNLDSSSVQYLHELSTQNSTPGMYAVNILQFFDTLVYIEPYIIPEELMKSEAIPEKPSGIRPTEEEYMNIYPNPALSYFVVYYDSGHELTNEMTLQVCDLSGKLVAEYQLQGNPGHKIISTREFGPGLYLCKFVCDGTLYETIKLTIIK